MHRFLLFIALLGSLVSTAQVSRDTVLNRCPVYITDTVSVNNFFLEARPATLKVYRVRGDLTIQVEQRDQFFTLFFHEKRLRATTYDIEPGSRGRGEVEAAYSFRSGDQTALISLTDGKIESTFDKEKKMWRVRVNGVITNMSDRTLSYYRVRTDLWLK